MSSTRVFCFFFFNDTATTEIYTLSLHDALPICGLGQITQADQDFRALNARMKFLWLPSRIPGLEAKFTYSHKDRKSTRLNSSHTVISYAVFCLKKKKKNPSNQLLRARIDNARHT